MVIRRVKFDCFLFQVEFMMRKVYEMQLSV
jgi:hypothetical protein